MEWWWLQSDSLADISESLVRDGYAVVDGFLLPSEARDLRIEVLEAYASGLLSETGKTGGGRSGKSTAYEDKSVRSDQLGYFDGTSSDWGKGDVLSRALAKMNTIVCELRDTKNVESGENLVHELRCVSTRSRAMVTCYPGGGSRYTRHCDNAIGNGRKLTSILYLNDGWSPSDGGELVLYPSLLSGREVRVEPTINRLVLFWSDIRCPHEVLPSHRDRFAVTVWFIDREERDRREALDAAEMNSTGTSDNCTTTTQPVLSGESTSQDGTGATYLISNITWKSYSFI